MHFIEFIEGICRVADKAIYYLSDADGNMIARPTLDVHRGALAAVVENKMESKDTEQTVRSEHDADTFDPMKVADNLQKNKEGMDKYLEITLDEKVGELIKRMALKTMG